MSNEQVEQWYDKDYFDRYPKHNRRIRQILSRVRFDSSDTVCEFGCGLGHILIAISDKMHFGLGIDVSEYAVSTAATTAKQAGITNIDFQSIDIEKLGNDSANAKSFDKVLMLDISEHLYDDTLVRFFKAAKSLLKSGGHLILHTPNADYYLERMKARNFILKQFESHIAVRNYEQHLPLLKSAGFSDVEVQYLPHYNRILKVPDEILMRLPFIERFFRARVLITATAP